MPEFSLKDYRGASYNRDDFNDSQLVVCAFLGTECPLARLYGPRLSKMAQNYRGKSVAFLGVNSNQQDSLSEIASYARRRGIEFPILKDVGNRLADQLGVMRNPEVVVWDRDHNIRYRGRIDDQYGVGYARTNPKRQDLQLAIDELLAGKPVSIAETEAVGCLIGRIRKPDAESSVTYSNQISRILQNRCVECHRDGDIAPFTLTRYEDVVGWSEMIAEVVQENRMPPWHADPQHGEFANDRRLLPEEKSQILEWVRRGAPQGDPKDLPEPRTFIVGSQLPREPDLELWMRDEPFTVKATGAVAYQNFVVDPKFTEDKWITMAEALPGNRAVVHHIVIFVRPPKRDGKDGFGQGFQFLTTYVPGYRARPLPPGMAKLVPSGSQLIFQLHYTPIGVEQTDRSKLRLLFAKPEEVDHVVLSTSVQIKHEELVIPPNATSHRSEASAKVPFPNARLLSLFPHMHIRGKSFRVDVRSPGEEAKTLLNVPRYDFNWQTTYRLRKPEPIAKGSELVIVGYHDNSEFNLANPDPEITVRWGDQTWEEMFIAICEWSMPIPESWKMQSKGESSSG